MTVVRALGFGMGMVVLATTLGCASRASPGERVTTAPGHSEPESQPASASPTAQLLALREQITAAREGGELSEERCVAGADGLTALHVRHGEPYVGARLEAAALLHECGRSEDARTRLLEGLDAMPRWARAEALNTLGVLAHERGDDGGALVHLNAALHLDPALHEGRSNLVRLLLRIYERGGSELARDDAQHHLEAWLELAPDDPMVLIQQARLLTLRARREPSAAEDLRKQADLLLRGVRQGRPGPTVEAEVLVVEGQRWLDSGDEVRAGRAFRGAIDLDPGLGSAALLAATIGLRMRDFEGARRLLVAASATVDPSEERTRLRLLAVALRGVRRYDEAAEVYEQLLAVEPPEPVDLYNRAQLERYRLGQGDGATTKALGRVRQRFDEVLVATGGKPEHAELERRARSEQRELDEEIALWRDATTERTLDAEAVELEALERKQRELERPRLLELEAKAKQAKRDAEAAAPEPQ